MAFPPIGSTCAEPPPEIMPTSEWAPMTAMVCRRAALSGSDGLFVLQQNDAAFFDLARSLKSGKGIDDAALAWIIDHAGGKHGAQNAMHVLVELGLWNLSGVDALLVSALS